MEAFETKLSHEWPLARWQKLKLLVAVSGGADSVALLRALHRLAQNPGQQLVVAHFNHQLRGKSALQDQAFVEELADQLKLEVIVGQANVAQLAVTWKSGLEETARRARYDFLQQTAEQLGARHLLLAHTENDQVETILHRILRGTGLAGLTGIPRTRVLSPAVSVIRPLLRFRRQEIIEYLLAIRQKYREDESNTDHRFTRNRIRHELLPLLDRQYQPDVANSLLRLSTQAAEVQALIHSLTTQIVDACMNLQGPKQAVVDCRYLATQPAYLARESLVQLWRQLAWPQQSMGYQQWLDLYEFAVAPATARQQKLALPGAVLATKTSDQLTLSRP